MSLCRLLICIADSGITNALFVMMTHVTMGKWDHVVVIVSVKCLCLHAGLTH